MEQIGMESPPPRCVFRSRLSALVWFFKKSRNGWKRKYRAVQESLRSCRSELRDVRRSREKWRGRVEALEAENRLLRGQLHGNRTDRSAEPSPPAPKVLPLITR